jgi:sister chromatid cohesion protein DCC1
MKVQFASDLKQKYRLLELSDPALLNAVKVGSTLYVKGRPEEEAVMCSNDCTFRVREIHTSNLHLFLEGNTITELTTSLLEAKKVPGRLNKLREYLEACPFEGPDEEVPLEDLKRLEMDTLFSEIQASDEEIRIFLADSGAILVDGKYRMMGSSYLCRFFKMLFSLLTINDLDLDGEVEKDRILEIFESESDEFPPKIIEHLLTVYASPGETNSDELKVLFDQRRICRFFAEELLMARPVWIQSEFLEAWRRLAGDLWLELGMISDMILREPISGSADIKISYFPATSLPVDPNQLFGKLFEMRSRWELATLEPFVVHASKVLGIEPLDLIVKNSRLSVDPNGTRIVTALLSV